VQLVPLPALSDNYIWMLVDEAGRGVFVDPGEPEPVFAAAANGVEPVGILLTHHHNDHIGGTAALVARWPELGVVAPEDPRIHNAARRVADGDRVSLGDWTFRALSVPGHTLTHTAYVMDGPDAALFSGDTLFSLGCGRLFEGTPAQMHASLGRLAALPGALRVCCGHEYTVANAAFALEVDPSNEALRARARQAQQLRAQGRPTLPVTLDDERATNPFLRCDQPAVRARVAERLGHAPADDVATFAELRAWKDGFRA